MANMKKYINILVVMLAFVSCESLQDTYKDFAGDGEFRYLGKCSDLSVQSGWNRLIVAWTNSSDPVIDKIKITWSKDGVIREKLLERGTTEYSIEGLEDGSYEIIVCAVDKLGNASLSSTVYGRPYTENHEMVQSFTRIISNHFFVKNRLILFFQGWEENVDEAYLEYTKTDGGEGKLQLTEEVVNGKLFLLPEEIDTGEPVYLYRTGRIADCNDQIVFAPAELEDIKLFNSDFKQEMKRQFGFDQDIPEGWSDTVEELCIDCSLGSFSDFLYFPNLKKIILGGHRYIREDMIDDEYAKCTVIETDKSKFVLEVLHTLNGLTVERYNKHYPDIQLDWIEEKGRAVEPEYDYFDLSGLNSSFVSTPQDENSYKSYPERLTDGKADTYWHPASRNEVTTFTLDLDLFGNRFLQGAKIVQMYADNENMRSYCPNSVRIFISSDNENWENATYVEESIIGNSMGETSIIPFAEGGKEARYVRIMVTTPFANSIYNVALAEINFW